MKLFRLAVAAWILAGLAAGCSEPKAVLPTNTTAAPTEEPQNIGMPK